MSDTLQQEIQSLQAQLAQLAREKHELETLLKVANEHADFVEKELVIKTESLEQERSELEMLLEMTNVHSDAVEQHLQDKVDHALLESERRLRQFMEALPVGILVTDTENKPYYLNQTARMIIGVTDGALSASQVMEHVRCFIEESDTPYPAEENPLYNAIYKNNIVENLQILKPDGCRVPLEVLSRPIYNTDNHVIFGIAAFRDISERKQAEIERERFTQALAELNASLEEKVVLRTQELTIANAHLTKEVEMRRQAEVALQEANAELSRLATVDGLTRVANRRRFDEYLKQQWSLLARQQLQLSLILCDIDFFKKYNDTYGHQGGDDCLAKVAQAIQNAVKRPSDLVARYGGEEFAVILPNTMIEGAEAVALLIQEELSLLQLPHKASEVSPYVTLSIGVAEVIPQQPLQMEGLIEAADQALYQAKRTGRNRVIKQVLQV